MEIKTKFELNEKVFLIEGFYPESKCEVCNGTREIKSFDNKPYACAYCSNGMKRSYKPFYRVAATPYRINHILIQSYINNEHLIKYCDSSEHDKLRIYQLQEDLRGTFMEAQAECDRRNRKEGNE